MNLSAQEAFSLVYARILAQGEGCTNGVGQCMYQYGDKRCAAGWLLSESDLQEAVMFGGNSSSLICEMRRNPFGCSPELVGALQRAHDSAAGLQFTEDRRWGEQGTSFLECYKANMARVAKQWNLQVES